MSFSPVTWPDLLHVSRIVVRAREAGVDQVRLIAAFQPWTREMGVNSAEHLLARSDLDANVFAWL